MNVIYTPTTTTLTHKMSNYNERQEYNKNKDDPHANFRNGKKHAPMNTHY